MNNSKLAVEATSLSEEQPKDRAAKLSEQEAKLVRILEAIRRVEESEAWSTLKNEVFDDLATRLERELREEARRDDPNTNKLNRIAGQLMWADRFSDLSKLEKKYRLELQGIRGRKPPDGAGYGS